MLSHGVSTGALFCLVGRLYDRRHTRTISEFGFRLGVVRGRVWRRHDGRRWIYKNFSQPDLDQD